MAFEIEALRRFAASEPAAGMPAYLKQLEQQKDPLHAAVQHFDSVPVWTVDASHHCLTFRGQVVGSITPDETGATQWEACLPDAAPEGGCACNPAHAYNLLLAALARQIQTKEAR